MEYDVIWGEGSLGLTLRPDLGEDMPPVVGRITKQDSTATRNNVAVGHLLISVNSIDTAAQGYDKTIELLQTVARPAQLRFRIPQQKLRKRRKEYTVVWAEGQLGLILQPDEDDAHTPAIRKVTGKGTGQGLEHARVGDILKKINGQSTREIGFRETVNMLRTINKPAVLRFQRARRRNRTTRGEYQVNIPDNSTSEAPPVETRSRSESHARRTKLTESESQSSITLQNTPLTREEAAYLGNVGQYDVIWREGEPGMKFKPGPKDTPLISRLTGRGTAGGLHNAYAGDELISINGIAVEGNSYRDILKQLKRAKKPAILRFLPATDRRKPGHSNASRESVAMRHSHPPSRTSGSAQQPIQGSTQGTEPTEEERLSKEHRRKRREEKKKLLRDRELQQQQKQQVSVAEQNVKAQPIEASSMSQRQRQREAYRRDRKKLSREGKKALFRRITLENATKIVVAAKGLNPKRDAYNGKLIRDIEDDTKDSHVLRVHSLKFILYEACSRMNFEHLTNNPKLLKEREEEVLDAAYDKLLEQADLYQEMLDQKLRDQVLHSALNTKSRKLVGLQNNVIAELSGVISEMNLKQDTSQDDAYEMDEISRESMMNELKNVMDMPADVLEEERICNECQAPESDVQLELDDDGEWYCLNCWEAFLKTQGIPVESNEVVEAVREEEADTNVENNKQGKRDSIGSGAGSSKGASRESDRIAREIQGQEELSLALKEEEEKALTEGNTDLAAALAEESEIARRRSIGEMKIFHPVSAAQSLDIDSDEDEDYWKSKREQARARIEARKAQLSYREDVEEKILGEEIVLGTAVTTGKVDAECESRRDSFDHMSQATQEAFAHNADEAYIREQAEKRDQERFEALDRRRERIGNEGEKFPTEADERLQFLEELGSDGAASRRQTEVTVASKGEMLSAGPTEESQLEPTSAVEDSRTTPAEVKDEPKVESSILAEKNSVSSGNVAPVDESEGSRKSVPLSEASSRRSKSTTERSSSSVARNSKSSEGIRESEESRHIDDDDDDDDSRSYSSRSDEERSYSDSSSSRSSDSSSRSALSEEKKAKDNAADEGLRSSALSNDEAIPRESHPPAVPVSPGAGLTQTQVALFKRLTSGVSELDDNEHAGVDYEEDSSSGSDSDDVEKTKQSTSIAATEKKEEDAGVWI